jgi:hypothetical protein
VAPKKGNLCISYINRKDSKDESVLIFQLNQMGFLAGFFYLNEVKTDSNLPWSIAKTSKMSWGQGEENITCWVKLSLGNFEGWK